MKRLITIALLFFAFTSYGQYTKYQLYQKIDQMSTYQKGYMQALSDSIVKSMALQSSISNIDNTSDANKPVSTAQAAADATKQPLDSDLTTISTVGSALQGLRVNSGGTAVEYYTPLTNPATTNGDIIYYTGTAYQRLAIGSSNYVLTVSGGLPSWQAVGSAGSLSALTAASGTNTINNGASLQEWQWNTLAGTSAFKLSSSSTAAASNAQKMFEVALSGANSTSTQTTYGGSISNTHTGTSSTNVALTLTASGANNNYALLTTGRVGIGTTAPARDFTINAALPLLSFSQSDVEKVLFGVSNASGALITGDVSGDVAFRTTGGRFLFSTNTGTTLHTSISAGAVSTTGALVGASFRMGIVTKTSGYTASITTDYTILGDATSGAFDVALPTAASAGGYIFVIMKIDASGNAVSINPNGSELINGSSTSLAIGTQWAKKKIQSNGTSWYVIGE